MQTPLLKEKEREKKIQPPVSKVHTPLLLHLVPPVLVRSMEEPADASPKRTRMLPPATGIRRFRLRRRPHAIGTRGHGRLSRAQTARGVVLILTGPWRKRWRRAGRSSVGGCRDAVLLAQTLRLLFDLGLASATLLFLLLQHLSNPLLLLLVSFLALSCLALFLRHHGLQTSRLGVDT